MLHEKWTPEALREVIIKTDAFRPFPRYEERDAWLDIMPETAGIWIKCAEEYKDYEWPAITAQMYLAARYTGELLPHWTQFRRRRGILGILALAECIEGKGRFLPQVINGIVSICEESVWVGPLALEKRGYDIPDASDGRVDLCVSETASLLAWISYLLAGPLDAVSLRIRERIKLNVYDRLIRLYMERDDYWWMGFVDARINNWNPWCNMNVIMSLMLVDFDDETRVNGLHKVIRSLDRYIETYSPDGCCDEGPMYWGAAGAGLYICLSYLRLATHNAVDGLTDERVREIGRYITKVHIDGHYFVSYADGDAKVKIDAATYCFGKAISDEGMMGLGASAPTLYPTLNDWFRANQYLNELFMEKERKACRLKPSYPRDSWLWKTAVMTARETEGTPIGLFLSAKGGNNIESHNHNDIGSFVVYADGKPVLIDVGTEEYSVKTFSPERFDIWYTQSQYHNCPGVNGVLQHEGREYCAEETVYTCTEEKAELEMDIRKAYPKEAGIQKWRRSIRLQRKTGNNPAYVSVSDQFMLEAASGEICRYFMTPCKPEVFNDGEIRLAYAEGKQAFIRFEAAQTELAAIEEIPMTESRLHGNWGDYLYRVVLKEKGHVKTGEMTATVGLC